VKKEQMRRKSLRIRVEDFTYQTQFDQTKGIKDSPLKSRRTYWIDESIGRRRFRAFIAKRVSRGGNSSSVTFSKNPFE